MSAFLLFKILCCFQSRQLTAMFTPLHFVLEKIHIFVKFYHNINYDPNGAVSKRREENIQGFILRVKFYHNIVIQIIL